MVGRQLTLLRVLWPFCFLACLIFLWRQISFYSERNKVFIINVLEYRRNRLKRSNAGQLFLISLKSAHEALLRLLLKLGRELDVEA